MGKPSLRRVELVEGRESFGKQSSWLITLKGFDTSEKVKPRTQMFLLSDICNPSRISDLCSFI